MTTLSQNQINNLSEILQTYQNEHSTSRLYFVVSDAIIVYYKCNTDDPWAPLNYHSIPHRLLNSIQNVGLKEYLRKKWIEMKKKYTDIIKKYVKIEKR